jgi:hypothetical protein
MVTLKVLTTDIILGLKYFFLSKAATTLAYFCLSFRPKGNSCMTLIADDINSFI